MTRPHIDWRLFGRALEFYRHSYSYVEAPWIVTDEAINVTLPPDRHGLRTEDGPLVGSAEQSFLQLIFDDELSPGSYCALTPCFRDDKPDATHQRYFMKLELIEFTRGTFEDPDERIRRIASSAFYFFAGQLAPGSQLNFVPTPDGLDIELNGIEIGSYGHRTLGDVSWIFGTGLAEPRFSMALGIT